MSDIEAKIVPINDTTDEVQLWQGNERIGAGAWDKPYDLSTAVQAILQVAMGRFSHA